MYSHFLKSDKRYHENSERIVDIRILFNEITQVLGHLCLPLHYIGSLYLYRDSEFQLLKIP